VIVVGLMVRILVATRRIRAVADPELRLLLAGLAAPMFALFAQFFQAEVTAASPDAPYFWFAVGALSYYLIRPRGNRAADDLPSRTERAGAAPVGAVA
jgi:hypothetical protein